MVATLSRFTVAGLKLSSPILNEVRRVPVPTTSNVTVLLIPVSMNKSKAPLIAEPAVTSPPEPPLEPSLFSITSVASVIPPTAAERSILPVAPAKLSVIISPDNVVIPNVVTVKNSKTLPASPTFASDTTPSPASIVRLRSALTAAFIVVPKRSTAPPEPSFAASVLMTTSAAKLVVPAPAIVTLPVLVPTLLSVLMLPFSVMVPDEVIDSAPTAVPVPIALTEVSPSPELIVRLV